MISKDLKISLVWFRKDLRLEDNPALNHAITNNRVVIPVYIKDEAGEQGWPMGKASQWWLHHGLSDLDLSLRSLGSKLVMREGNSLTILKELIQTCRVDAVYWNRRYEPAIIERDKEIKTQLKSEGIEVKSFNASLLFEPHEIKNKSGRPFQVFTPYWKHCCTRAMPQPIPVDLKNMLCPQAWPDSLNLDALLLLPQVKWDHGFYKNWTPTVKAGHLRLQAFIKKAVDDYDLNRDLPHVDGTSRLSPYLHFGQLSPRQIWHAFVCASKTTGLDVDRYLSEIGWREFSYHLLYHFPDTPESPLRKEFESFPWKKDEALLKVWQKGATGYPIVDAGLRQLWATGWMHNRVRMIAASVLVKHLLQPWQAGAHWFWDTLVDADLASNTQGWQWTAGCGADASPYFRVFNPIIQGEKFDPDGDYVRTWVPELSPLPNQYIHQPWNASDSTLESAGIRLGVHYPLPVIKHEAGRSRALDAYQQFKETR